MSNGATERSSRSGSTGSAGRNWSRLIQRVLLVVFCVTLVLSVVSVWARNQITDTDRYVQSVAPLARDPAIQSALADRVAGRVSAELQGRIEFEFLPEENAFLSAPLENLLEQYIRDSTERVLASDGFADVWERMNRAAHPAVSAVLTGRDGDLASLEDGRITIDIEPLVTNVIDSLRAEGFDAVDRIRMDDIDTSFAIFESEGIAQVQDVVGHIERLAVVLPIAMMASLVATIWLADNRRRSIVVAGILMSAAMALLFLLLYVGRWWGISHLPPDVDTDAAVAFFDTVTTYLRRATLTLLLVGVVISLVASRLDRSSGARVG